MYGKTADTIEATRNRTILELKRHLADGNFFRSFPRNRTILELKLAWVALGGLPPRTRNRTILELKHWERGPGMGEARSS